MAADVLASDAMFTCRPVLRPCQMKASDSFLDLAVSDTRLTCTVGTLLKNDNRRRKVHRQEKPSTPVDSPSFMILFTTLPLLLFFRLTADTPCAFLRLRYLRCHAMLKHVTMSNRQRHRLVFFLVQDLTAGSFPCAASCDRGSPA